MLDGGVALSRADRYRARHPVHSEATDAWAGAPTRLVFVNEGAIEHDITIPGPSAGESAEGHGDAEASHTMGTLAHGTVHATAAARDRAIVEFTPKAGTYEFACTIPGHKEAGTVGTLRVQ